MSLITLKVEHRILYNEPNYHRTENNFDSTLLIIMNCLLY